MSRSQQERQKEADRRANSPTRGTGFGQPLKSSSVGVGNVSGQSRSQQERQSEAVRKQKVQQSSSFVGTSFTQAAAPAPAPVPQLTTFPVPPKINNSNMNGQNNMASVPSSPPATTPSAATPPASSSSTKPQNTLSEQKKVVSDNKELNSKKEGNTKMESAKITTFPIAPKINNVREEVRKAPELQKGPVDPQKLLADALNTMTVRQLKAYIRMSDKKTTLKATSRKKEYVNAALAIAQDKGLDDSLAELQNKVKI
jgi:hypothetical protein